MQRELSVGCSNEFLSILFDCILHVDYPNALIFSLNSFVVYLSCSIVYMCDFIIIHGKSSWFMCTYVYISGEVENKQAYGSTMSWVALERAPLSCLLFMWAWVHIPILWGSIMLNLFKLIEISMLVDLYKNWNHEYLDS